MKQPNQNQKLSPQSTQRNAEENNVLVGMGIRCAASLARGDRLCVLYELCYNQKRVSSSVLLRHLDKLHDGLRDDAYMMRKLSDHV